MSSESTYTESRFAFSARRRATPAERSRIWEEEQIHILQIDTRKAFDSLDHSFIHLCLEKVGFPVWLLNIVHLLLTDVFVIPVVSAHTAVLIPIRRGVKQGCPLSPLLFVLAYDPRPIMTPRYVILFVTFTSVHGEEERRTLSP